MGGGDLGLGIWDLGGTQREGGDGDSELGPAQK